MVTIHLYVQSGMTSKLDHVESNWLRINFAMLISGRYYWFSLIMVLRRFLLNLFLKSLFWIIFQNFLMKWTSLPRSAKPHVWTWYLLCVSLYVRTYVNLIRLSVMHVGIVCLSIGTYNHVCQCYLCAVHVGILFVCIYLYKCQYYLSTCHACRYCMFVNTCVY